MKKSILHGACFTICFFWAVCALSESNHVTCRLPLKTNTSPFPATARLHGFQGPVKHAVVSTTYGGNPVYKMLFSYDKRGLMVRKEYHASVKPGGKPVPVYKVILDGKQSSIIHKRYQSHDLVKGSSKKPSLFELYYDRKNRIIRMSHNHWSGFSQNNYTSLNRAGFVINEESHQLNPSIHGDKRWQKNIFQTFWPGKKLANGNILLRRMETNYYIRDTKDHFDHSYATAEVYHSNGKSKTTETTECHRSKKNCRITQKLLFQCNRFDHHRNPREMIVIDTNQAPGKGPRKNNIINFTYLYH